MTAKVTVEKLIKEIKRNPNPSDFSNWHDIWHDIDYREKKDLFSIEGWEYVSKFINVPEIKVLEIATFYSMYNLSPVGKFHIEICTTSPCMLRGSDDILSFCEKKLAVGVGGVSKDKMFSLSRVECLGACVNAPVVKINENYYEDLDLNTTDKLINNIANDKKVKIGSQSGRMGSEPRKSSYDKKR